MEKCKFLDKNKISLLPKAPGVYLFKKGREVLYIGKAANLRERVKNHFQQPNFRDNLFLEEVKKIGYIKTGSEIEALILEAELIKKRQPKFNILWRDDKNYFFVAVSKEEFPKVFIAHQLGTVPVQGQSLGPFVDGAALKQTLRMLRRVFPFRSCRTLPKRPCLWYQLERCPAPCLLQSGLGSKLTQAKLRIKKECQANAKNLIKILQGKKNQVMANFKKQMKAASKNQEFERAAKIRDQIEALERVLQHAKILSTSILPSMQVEEDKRQVLRKVKDILGLSRIPKRIEAYDVSNIQGIQATGAMVVFEKGAPAKNWYRKFKVRFPARPNDIAMLKEVLSRRLKHPEWPLPDLILIDGGKAQLNATLRCLKPEVKHLKVVALAKKINELFLPNKKKPILLKTLPQEISNLILHIRDEAHRFAISYHRRLRKTTFIS